MCAKPPMCAWMIAASLAILPGGCPLSTSVLDDSTTAPENDDRVADSLANSAPLAAAGDDVTVSPGDLVVLAGTGSTDADGDRLQYFWRQVDGDETVKFDGSPFASIVTFTAPETDASLLLTFRVTVGDSFAAAVDEITITVTP